jgi:inosine triphosphate pyrophosphatase
MAPSNFVFVTGSASKLNLVRDVLGDTIELEFVNLNLTERQGTIEEIAKDKCRQASNIVNFYSIFNLVSINFYLLVINRLENRVW